MKYDWNRYGNPGSARFTRIMTWVLAALAVAAWALFLLAGPGDWTLVVVPLVATAGAAVNPLAVRRHYGVRQARLLGPLKPFAEAQGGGPGGFRVPAGSGFAATATLEQGGYRGITVEYRADQPGFAGVASRQPYIQVDPMATRLLITGRVVISSWGVVTRGQTNAEVYGRLRDAEPLLLERMPELMTEEGFSSRWFRLADGELRAPCGHPDAVPVDTLWTRERVAWLCPECDAQLPADWA